MKTLYCDLIKGDTEKACSTKVLLLDLTRSTVFPHTHPSLFARKMSVAKHCPKCEFITGWAHESVLEKPEPDWAEIKRKHDVFVSILKKEPKQLVLFND